MLPHSVTYTTKVQGGDARMCYVRIHPKHRKDEGLHAHEYEHVKQWYVSVAVLSTLLLLVSVVYSFDFLVLAPLACTVHGVLYRFSKKYRKYSEVRAFREQLKHYPEQIDFFAEFLSTNYNLDITPEEAKELLTP